MNKQELIKKLRNTQFIIAEKKNATKKDAHKWLT